MALPFYVIAVTGLGLRTEHVALLLAAQTSGSLASNLLWGRIGDRYGKLRLLEAVGALRLVLPFGALVLLATTPQAPPVLLVGSLALFVLAGALVNGMTIGYLGYLMEISPDDRRPAYSAYFNALASPAALLPVAGATFVDVASLPLLFVLAALAAPFQILVYARLRLIEAG